MLSCTCFANAQELFDVEDARLCTKHPSTYMVPGETATVGQLEDRSRAYGEIIVGYLDHDNKGECMLRDKDKVTQLRRLESVDILNILHSFCQHTDGPASHSAYIM